MATHEAEAWLAEMLKSRGIDLYTGEFPTLRERLRASIIAGRVAHTIIGRRPDGASETYLQFFERVFREPLYGAPQPDSTRRENRSHGQG